MGYIILLFAFIGMAVVGGAVMYVLIFKLPCWLGFHRYEDTTGFGFQRKESCVRCRKTKYLEDDE